jgi:hypothetical protein
MRSRTAKRMTFLAVLVVAQCIAPQTRSAYAADTRPRSQAPSDVAAPNPIVQLVPECGQGPTMNCVRNGFERVAPMVSATAARMKEACERAAAARSGGAGTSPTPPNPGSTTTPQALQVR